MFSFSEGAFSQKFEVIPGWRYLPLEKEFYESALEGIEKGQASRVYQLVLKAREKVKGTTEEGEADLVISKLCQKYGLKFCSYHYAYSAASEYRGSSPGIHGLQIIEELLKDEPLYDGDVLRLVNSGGYQSVPINSISMLNYYVTMDNLSKGLTAWGLRSSFSMGKSSFWKQKWEYESALELARRGDVKLAMKKILALGKQPSLSSALRFDMGWQLARLKFEVKDYRGAKAIYDKLSTSNLRWMGQILREKAWAFYWMKSYAEVLGAIKTLKAPMYANSMHPELYLLEMLTLRKLCHFSSVKEVFSEFNESFSATYEDIKSRRPLEENLSLVYMSFMNGRLDPLVETVSMIREEKEKVSSEALRFSKALKDELFAMYSDSERRFRSMISEKLDKDLRVQAENFLESREQVQLIDYLSNLDAFSIKQGFDERSYKARKASSFSYNFLYWPVETEYWSDELKSYQVLVEDQCGKGGS